jgi:glutamate racemase
VELAEGALAGEPPPPERLRGVLAGLFGQPGGERVDVIVNACTHFPLLEEALAAAAPHPVRFIDGGHGIARRVAHLTQGQEWPGEKPAGRAVFTRLDAEAEALAPALARYGLTQIESL